jgi:hypothetical protein
MDNIPSGYSLHITSWENDADNYKTKIVSGLTKEDVQFYLHFLNHFEMNKPYGNGGITKYPDAEKNAITNAYEKCRPTSPQLLEDVENSIEYWKTSDFDCDWVHETIGIWGYGERYRVFDSCEVYLIRTQIPNVTGEFVDGYLTGTLASQLPQPIL